MEGTPTQQLKKYLEPYSKDELQSLIMSLATNDMNACNAVLTKIKTDKKWCKLFVHGLAFSTSKETLENHYKLYGKVKEAVVLVDKKGNSKGYGFVTFENAKFALEAAKDPKKRIDNRVTHCNLAFKGNPKKFALSGNSSTHALSPKQRENANDRRLFVHSLAWKTDDESLADVFREYGELQEAVVIRDKKTGKSKGYGFVTFKYSESAQSALAEPNKKIDGRQTHCNYACERSNINGGNGPSGNASNDASVNSPNSINQLTSHNAMNMNMNPNNSMNSMNSANAGRPILGTFGSNPPLSLNPNISASSNSNSMQRSNPFATNIHNPQLGSGIDISQIPTNSLYHNSLIGSMPGAPSPQRRGLVPGYNAPYGQSQPSPYGQPPPHPSHSQHIHHPQLHNDHPLSHLISPQSSHNDPTVSLLRNMQPTSPIPTALMGNLGLSQMLVRNTQSAQGNQFPGTPSNLVLGPSQSHGPPNTNSIVVGGMNNNLFTSPIPPQPPATPPYTHVQTKENLYSGSSPYHGGGPQPLSIPGFKPGIGVGGLSTLEPIHHQPLPTQKKIIATNNSLISVQPTFLLNNGTHNANNIALQMIRNPPANHVAPAIKVPPPTNVVQHVEEGNLSPKSQGPSDDEGEDDVVKK
eukprot:28103_1